VLDDQKQMRIRRFYLNEMVLQIRSRPHEYPVVFSVFPKPRATHEERLICHCYWAKRSGKEFSKALTPTQIGAPRARCGDDDQIVRSVQVTLCGGGVDSTRSANAEGSWFRDCLLPRWTWLAKTFCTTRQDDKTRQDATAGRARCQLFLSYTWNTRIGISPMHLECPLWRPWAIALASALSSQAARLGKHGPWCGSISR
jgi:hypothetical protein